MEALEEVTASPKDLCQIVKGKRTKRQRPQSPIPFTIATHSSSGDGGCGSNAEGDCIDNNNNATSVSDDEFRGTTTEEDEHMAKCLILLAQGHHLKETSNKIDQDQDQNFGTDPKFTSKRYIETPISANGKAGMYVYQCKTCGRTFPSFQALGGHRASHKKPKNVAAGERKMFLASSDDEEEPIKNNNNGNRNRRISSLTLELSSRGMYGNLNTDSSKSSTPTPKVHECSNCGAEFTSGQALGGHMRRHRGQGATVSTTTNTTLSLSPISPGSIDQETDEAEAKRSKYGLSLDLNLPAPEDDHHRDSRFASVSKQPHQQHEQQQQQHEKQEQGKQQALVLSTRRLIECQN